MNFYQDAFEVAMEATKRNAENSSFSPEVRAYAMTVYMAMQAQYTIAQMQEAAEVDAMFPPSAQ